MTSNDLVKKTHDIDKIVQTEKEVEISNNQGNPLTPEDQDDNFIEGGDVASNLDEINKRAKGDASEDDTISEAINKDEEALAND